MGSECTFVSSLPQISHRVDKKFYRPTTIQSFAIIIFERPQRFTENDARDMGKALLDACGKVGIIIQDTNPSVFFANAQNGVIRVGTRSPSFHSSHAYHQAGADKGRQRFQPTQKTESPAPSCCITRGSSRHIYSRQTVSVALTPVLHCNSSLPTVSVTFA